MDGQYMNRNTLRKNTINVAAVVNYHLSLNLTLNQSIHLPPKMSGEIASQLLGAICVFMHKALLQSPKTQKCSISLSLHLCQVPVRKQNVISEQMLEGCK